jgi:putative ABC transport system permease protein
LILISFIIASPLSWYFMHHWLQGYATRISISWWIFVLAGSGAVLIALLTISFQSVKAAIANPVKSLKTE